jgi:hypothetical protein
MFLKNVFNWPLKIIMGIMQSRKRPDLIPKELQKIYVDIASFSTEIQMLSKKKNGDHETLAGHAIYRLHSEALAIHHAVLDMCLSGWTRFCPLLLRAQLEIVTYMALIAKSDHDFRAFKYLFKESLMENIDGAKESINCLIGADKDRADKYIKEEEYKKGFYWFNPEFGTVKDVMTAVENKFGDTSAIKMIYGVLSKAAHVSQLGLNLFKDACGDIEIIPTYNPDKSALAICMTCRILLEANYVRGVFEGLSVHQKYRDIAKKYNDYGGKLMIEKGYIASV